MSAQEIAPGTQLIAGPDLLDPNFRRTVVLICEHTDQGSLGLVVNRPTNVTLDHVVPDLTLPGSPQPDGPQPGAPGTIYSGGPVESNRLMIVRLGGGGDASEELQEVYPGIALVVDISATLDRLRESQEELEHYRFFLGYAGWGKGQLDGEMRDGSWLLEHSDPGGLFESEGEAVWRDALARRGGIYLLYAQMPHDPSMN